MVEVKGCGSILEDHTSEGMNLKENRGWPCGNGEVTWYEPANRVGILHAVGTWYRRELPATTSQSLSYTE